MSKLEELRKAEIEAREAYEIWHEAYVKTSEKVNRAWEAYGMAREACMEACEAEQNAHRALQIERAREALEEAWVVGRVANSASKTSERL